EEVSSIATVASIAGERSCPREAAANVVALFFLTSMISLTIEVPTGEPALAFDEVLGLSLRPRSQELVFRAREVFSYKDLRIPPIYKRQ
ncbi:hypothetical protein MRX96_051981, partial [Rhipicephalus microplus]